MRDLLALVATLLLAAASPAAASPAAAQQRPAPVQVPEAPVPEGTGISPGGAFWRALAFPGWGHAAIGSHARGGFYFAAQTMTAYTFVRARIRLGEARERARFREGILLERLAEEGITDSEVIETRLAEDAALEDLRGLVDAREEQQEDMVALGLFLLLLSGADAYVSAHLARFPEPLELEARPGPQGTVDVGLRLGLPR